MSQIKGRHVLFIEPDKALVDVYIQALKSDGISSVWSPSAQGAIDVIDEKAPGLIVLEVQLQGHNGVEFLNELRSYPEWCNIPVMLLTYVPEHELGLTSQGKQLLNVVRYCYKPQTSLRSLRSIIADIMEESLA